MEIQDAQWFNEDWLKTVDVDTAAAAIENSVYQAAHLLERLEGVGRLRGNGHHAMQEVAQNASKVLRERFNG